jgi:predicted O-methyltransferase YrrM
VASILPETDEQRLRVPVALGSTPRSGPSAAFTTGGAISETSGPTDPGRAYAETYLPEDEVLTAARQRGTEVGAGPIGPGGGAALRLLATAVNARHVVEVGTGCGVSGLWLLRGMTDDGVLTSVDVEPEHQRLAKLTFAEAGIAPARARLISGRALDVLPRLTDAAYDLVFCDADKAENADYLVEALRLLRPGGIVAFDNALARNRVGDSSARDDYTVAVRELGKQIRDDPRLVPALLPVGDGLLVAVRRADPD